MSGNAKYSTSSSARGGLAAAAALLNVTGKGVSVSFPNNKAPEISVSNADLKPTRT